MPELPKPRTWIIAPHRTFADVGDVANAEAAANGWAVKVERVVVDGVCKLTGFAPTSSRPPSPLAIVF